MDGIQRERENKQRPFRVMAAWLTNDTFQEKEIGFLINLFLFRGLKFGMRKSLVIFLKRKRRFNDVFVALIRSYLLGLIFSFLIFKGSCGNMIIFFFRMKSLGVNVQEIIGL